MKLVTVVTYVYEKQTLTVHTWFYQYWKDVHACVQFVASIVQLNGWVWVGLIAGY